MPSFGSFQKKNPNARVSIFAKSLVYIKKKDNCKTIKKFFQPK